MKNNKNHIVLLGLLKQYLKKNPDLRVGQALENLKPHLSLDIFYVEDDVLIAQLKSKLGIE
jgi:uncharacterized protein YihD (DUF1040 family)